MHSAGGVKSSRQTETQQEVGAGGPRQSLPAMEEGNWIILLAVGGFLSLRTTDESLS